MKVCMETNSKHVQQTYLALGVSSICSTMIRAQADSKHVKHHTTTIIVFKA